MVIQPFQLLRRRWNTQQSLRDCHCAINEAKGNSFRSPCPFHMLLVELGDRLGGELPPIVLALFRCFHASDVIHALPH